MLRTFSTLALAAAAVAAAGTLTPTATANAAVAGCASNQFCAWSGDGQAGRRVAWAKGVNDANWGVRADLHDDAESLRNAAVESGQTPDSVQTYLDPSFRRAGICLLPGESADTAMTDNAYDSHRWVPSCG